MALTRFSAKQIKITVQGVSRRIAPGSSRIPRISRNQDLLIYNTEILIINVRKCIQFEFKNRLIIVPNFQIHRPVSIYRISFVGIWISLLWKLSNFCRILIFSKIFNLFLFKLFLRIFGKLMECMFFENIKT